MRFEVVEAVLVEPVGLVAAQLEDIVAGELAHRADLALSALVMVRVREITATAESGEVSCCHPSKVLLALSNSLVIAHVLILLLRSISVGLLSYK